MRAAEPELAPVGVCEILRELASWENKDVAVLGRYSYRPSGRWVSEQACEPATANPPELWIVEDDNEAPRPPARFEFDAAVVRRKLAEIARHTSLGTFRFGTPGYDRWAVVYGRIQARKGDDAHKASANLVIRGSSVIVFLNLQ